MSQNLYGNVFDQGATASSSGGGGAATPGYEKYHPVVPAESRIANANTFFSMGGNDFRPFLLLPDYMGFSNDSSHYVMTIGGFRCPVVPTGTTILSSGTTATISAVMGMQQGVQVTGALVWHGSRVAGTDLDFELVKINEDTGAVTTMTSTPLNLGFNTTSPNFTIGVVRPDAPFTLAANERVGVRCTNNGGGNETPYLSGIYHQ